MQPKTRSLQSSFLYLLLKTVLVLSRSYKALLGRQSYYPLSSIEGFYQRVISPMKSCNSQAALGQFPSWQWRLRCWYRKLLSNLLILLHLPEWEILPWRITGEFWEPEPKQSESPIPTQELWWRK